MDELRAAHTGPLGTEGEVNLNGDGCNGDQSNGEENGMLILRSLGVWSYMGSIPFSDEPNLT
jgi:hypothetical protein